MSINSDASQYKFEKSNFSAFKPYNNLINNQHNKYIYI